MALDIYVIDIGVMISIITPGQECEGNALGYICLYVCLYVRLSVCLYVRARR